MKTPSPPRGGYLGAAVLCLALLGRDAGAAGQLSGTVVLDAGRSYAFFSQGGGSWRVEEGGELPEGGRLVEVRDDRVVVEAEGERREVYLFTTVVAPGRAGPASALPGRAVAARAGAPASSGAPSPQAPAPSQIRNGDEDEPSGEAATAPGTVSAPAPSGLSTPGARRLPLPRGRRFPRSRVLSGSQEED